MRHIIYHIIIAIFLFSLRAYGQISPGELSQAHAELEGMGNCTQCHDLGHQVSSAKCLDCHEDIQSMIDLQQGYHASKEVTNKECFECHSEHHGRKFDAMRFDQDAFDHDLTGYPLEGQHDVIDCRDCHQSEFIKDSEISERENTFMGLSQECLACHDDFHQGTLSDDCAACHDIEAFRPAPGFDHDEADFKLLGKHIDVDCKECHPMTIRNELEFQEFTDLEFGDCISCHDDAHNSQITGLCVQCHVETSFEDFKGQENFDHNTTNFTLKGKHNDVSCFECHQQTSEPLQVFQDHLGVGENQCITCHEDVHDGKFGDDCAQCHNEESWLSINDMTLFNHDLTDYPLEGKHAEVDCKECHTGERYTEPIDFSNCSNCHDDYHEGEFVKNDINPDCRECHTVEGFDRTLFTIEQHQETEFPLEGAHMATPCFACHIDEKDEKWTFRSLGSDCYECHTDVHNGEFEENGVTDCATCHVSRDWYPDRFDHDKTDFPLDGEHADVACDQCHKPYEESGQTYILYKIKKFECVDCHTQ